MIQIQDVCVFGRVGKDECYNNQENFFLSLLDDAAGCEAEIHDSNHIFIPPNCDFDLN